jgi:hypothetical protein
MEEMVQDRGDVAIPGRDLHDLGQTPPLQVCHVPSEDLVPVADEALDQLPSAPDRRHLAEEPREEPFVVAGMEEPMLQDGR